MPQPLEKIAVLFADVCGSTTLYEKLGDTFARQMVMRCINTMIGQIPTYKGTLIKTIGDEIMCTFPDAEAAFHAACSMQTAVQNDRPLNGMSMQIRIGFNYGVVINEFDDVFGNTVNVASRVASITRAGQIMATQAVYDAVPLALRASMRQILRAEFKGMQDRFEIYQVIHEKEDTLSTRIGIPAFRRTADNNDELVLSYRGQSVKVNLGSRNAVLGRDETCDLVVENDLASRQHVRVELRVGKFIIVDQSTNGTYIRSVDGSVVHITREEAILSGSGSISLGQAFIENPTELVEYSIVTNHAAG